MSLITLKNVSKFYYSKGVIASGFNKVNLELNNGEFVAITGESGSGKSTLLNVISGLDSYEEGEMYINGKETSHYTEKDFEDYRRKYIGNIFQSFNLVNSYTVYQNIELVLLLNGSKKKDIKNNIITLIKKVGLYKFRNTKVSKLSGGQKQRVAIARALAKDTPIILADEPTGNLDSKSSCEVLKLLSEISKEKLVIVVTHNYDQIEKYVTRKITMSDGKIIENKEIKEVNSINVIKESSYKDLTFLNKLRLGIRNVFNIKVKFILLLFIFLFINFAISIEYSSFKDDEYLTKKTGSNDFFQDTNLNRIVVTKKDNTSFIDEDYKTIAKLENIKSIDKNDSVIETTYSVTDNNDIWFDGKLKPLSELKGKIDIGDMPVDDYGIIIETEKDNYYITNDLNKILENNFSIFDQMVGSNVNSKKYKISGIKYFDSFFNDYGNANIYVSDNLLKEISIASNRKYSKTYIKFNKIFYEVEPYSYEYNITPSKNVKDGKIVLSSNHNYLCKKENCKNKNIKIKVNNRKFNEELSLKVTNTYNKRNYKKYYKAKYYYDVEGKVFISENDYKKLYDKGIYQISIRLDNPRLSDKTSALLKEKGYNTFVVSDYLTSPTSIEMVQILKTVVTIVLIVILFFICYFVTKLILKSRRIYFSTIRMLGSTKKICKNLLSIELYIFANISYLIFIFTLILTKLNIIKYRLFKNLIEYMGLFELVFIYLVITIMSYIISLKFSRDIFRKTAQKAYKEED